MLSVTDTQILASFLPQPHAAPVSAPDWVLIIGAIAGGVVLVINAWGTYFGRKEAREAALTASGKLDVIHRLTNSSMTALKTELETALARIEKLEGLLTDALHRADVP